MIRCVMMKSHTFVAFAMLHRKVAVANRVRCRGFVLVILGRVATAEVGLLGVWRAFRMLSRPRLSTKRYVPEGIHSVVLWARARA